MDCLRSSLCGLAFAWTVVSVAPVRAQADVEGGGDAVLRPTAGLDLPTIETWVSAHAPDVEAAQLDTDVARAEVTKAYLLPDFSLDASWATIPIGTTTPPGLPRPFANVPNYNVGVTYTLPIGKRGPRQERAEALLEAARANLAADVRARALQVTQLLGALATSTLRVEGLLRLVDNGRQQLRVAEAKVAAQALAGLEFDRLQIDVSRLEQAVSTAESDQTFLLSMCASAAGTLCAPFADAAAAREFLQAWIDRVPVDAQLAERPDLRALDAQARAANAEARWARAQSIPDPTFRLGYTHDRFVESGNQLNSLNVSVSIPLPIFDHGQAELAAAHARRQRAQRQRDKRLQSSRSRLPVLRARLAAQLQRQRVLREEILPRTEAMLEPLVRTADSGLIPISDVIQARRTVSDLLLDEIDSLSDAFTAALEITAEIPTPTR